MIALVQAGVVAGLLVLLLLLLLALLWRSAPAADAIACSVRWRRDVHASRRPGWRRWQAHVLCRRRRRLARGRWDLVHGGVVGKGNGLRGFQGPAGGRRVCALLRCEGSTGRAANGGLARSDSTAEPQGLANEAQRARARARGAVWAEATEEARALGRRDCRVLACVAGGCAVKELLRASRHGAAGGSSSGCRLQAAGALSLSLSPLGGRGRGRGRGRRGVPVPVRHQQTDLRSVAVPGELRAPVRLGWLRSGYESDTTRGQWRRGRSSKLGPGEWAHQRPSTKTRQDWCWDRDRDPGDTIRAEMQKRAVAAGASTLKPSAPALRRRAVRHLHRTCTGDGGRLEQ